MIEYDTRRWTSILTRVHGSVLPRIWWRVLLVAVVATALTFAQLWVHIEFPTSSVLHSIVGVALGLLLVFRTNSSYDRYWEGRKIIGHMVNRSRNLARQAASYLSESPADVRRRVGCYTIAYFAVIRRSLRRERETSELDQLLSPAERAVLLHSSAPPLLVARWISDVLQAEAMAGRLNDRLLVSLDNNICEMNDRWGDAERILKTPVPFAYAHHIKGFLMVFCLTVPVSLIGSMGCFTPLGAMIVAYGLLGIDEIGVEIEEPFGYDANDLPMDGIGATITRNVCDALDIDASELLPPPEPVLNGVYR